MYWAQWPACKISGQHAGQGALQQFFKILCRGSPGWGKKFWYQNFSEVIPEVSIWSFFIDLFFGVISSIAPCVWVVFTLQGHLGSHLRCYQNRQQHSFWISFSETPDFSLKFRPEKLATTQRLFGYILWRKKTQFCCSIFQHDFKSAQKSSKKVPNEAGPEVVHNFRYIKFLVLHKTVVSLF